MDVQVIVFWCRVAAAAFVALALLMLLWAGWQWHRGGARRYCPGTRGRWARLNVLRSVAHRPCGYDLSGLPCNGDGKVTCPECGTRIVAASAALRRCSRWRPGRMAAAAMLLAALVYTGPMLKTHPWQRRVPTTVLIAVKRTLGAEWTPTRLRRELDRRIRRGGLYTWQVRMALPSLRADLRADSSQGNAYRAMEFLTTYGDTGRAALETSLNAPDYQERQMAAAALRDSCFTWSGPEYSYTKLREPSDDLLRVTVEGLKSDKINWNTGTTGNAYGGVRFLRHFPERAAPFVAQGLASNDAQQRILCASLAALGQRRELYDRAVPILVSHLASNNVYGDGRYAAAAMAVIGPDAVPSLIQMRSMGDPQQRNVAAALLKRLDPSLASVADVALYRALSSADWNGEAPFGYSLSNLTWTVWSGE